MKWFPSLLLMGALSMGACQGQTAESSSTTTTEAAASFQNIQVAGAQTMINSGEHILIDVRTPGEFTEAHIDGATMIDINGSDFESGMAALDKSKSYVVICRSGGRSARASQYMIDHGFTKVTNVEGGMNAWLASGYPSVAGQ
ncbi:MAG: hypothetical protein RL577_284 [Bacteroidota bacterium]|jgi:rhodanese-related sulfurtransferase